MKDKNDSFELEDILNEFSDENDAVTEEPIAVPPKKVFELHLNLDDEYGEPMGDTSSAKSSDEPSSESSDEEVQDVTVESENQDAEKVPKKPVFRLNLDLDSEYGEPIPVLTQKEQGEEVDSVDETPDTADDSEQEETTVHTKPQKTRPVGIGCLWGLLYSLLVFVLAGSLAYVLIVGGLDLTGLIRGSETVDVVIQEGASTEEIANILKEKGLIDQPAFFRVYVKLMKGDGKWQPGEFSLEPDMGYQVLVEQLQTMKKRATVKVTIPEGFTVRKIAERLESKGVCSAEDFYKALREGNYQDYDFIEDLKNVDQSDYEHRFYALEGYLFPDTYEFYVGCSGESAVRKFLDGFDNKLDTALRSAAKNKGLTMDELIIFASIVQGEASSKKDMEKVARVLWNRLENTAQYPKLECDSTLDYVKKQMAGNTDIQVESPQYDTYVREGFPVGAINNPGLDAIKAVLFPSEDATISKCYFFATDYDSGTTYYSKTLKEHEQICRKYGIGMYG